MDESIRRRFEEYERAPRTWDPALDCEEWSPLWNDILQHDLATDQGGAFERVAKLMLSGHYYPPDVMDCFGRWSDEGRDIEPGDRMLQRARLLPFLAWPVLWSMTEIFVAERTDTMCRLGYVTTARHFGRGIWQSTVTRADGVLKIQVVGKSGPQSWLFWVGLPVARFLQMRAWRRGVQNLKAAAEGP